MNEDAVDAALLDVTTLFDDPEYPASELTYSVVNNSDPSTLASASINGSDQLVATGAANMYGMSEVSIEATDPAGNVAFTVVPVIVGEANQAPTVTSAIPAQTVASGSTPTLVDLWNYFSDREDGSYLTYSVASDTNPGLFSELSVDDNGFLNMESYQSSGTATLTITATDRGGLSVTSAPFTVTAGSSTDLPYIQFLDSGIIPAIEGADDPGYVKLQRSGGDLSQPLTVEYQAGGTAVPGVDYQALPGSITFAAGSDTAELDVYALVNTTSDYGAVVQLSFVDSGTTWRSDANASATIDIHGTYFNPFLDQYEQTIYGPETYPGVDFDARVYDVPAGASLPDASNLTFNRTADNIDQPLTVYYQYVPGDGQVLINGGAPPAAGTDGTITFPAGVSHISFDVTPVGTAIADGMIEIVSDPNPVQTYFGYTGEDPSQATPGTYQHYQQDPENFGASIEIQAFTPPPVSVDLQLLGIDHATQQSPGAYLPVDDSNDAGLTGSVSTTADGVTYQAPGQLADNQADRNLRNVIPDLPAGASVNDLWAATVTIVTVNGTPLPRHC